MEKLRIIYLDAAKALAIFLVVLGHVIVFHDSESYNNPLARVIYSFHTALFMFMSGYFFESCLKRSFVTVLRDKSRQLLLPYLCWSVVSLFLINIPEAGFANLTAILKGYIMGGVFRYYWYFKALFLYIVVTYALIKITRNKWIGCLTSFVIFTILPNFAFTRYFIPFFLAGFLIRPMLEREAKWREIVVVLVANTGLFICKLSILTSCT